VIARVWDALQVEVEIRSLFEAPTVAGIAELIEANRQTKKITPLTRISPARRDKAAVSFAQQRLWFLEQFESCNPVYNISRSVRLEGRLEVAALERSVNELVRRHESLRTYFSVVDGQPAQVIAPVLTLTPAVFDLSGIPNAERKIEALRLATEEACRPFDLSCGPLLRVALLRLGAEEHILILTMHHIVSDGWSLGVLFRELSVLYDAFLAGKSSPLPDLPIQYADFSVWQRRWLQGDVLETQLGYWKNQLEGIPAVLNLPTDHPRPAVQRYQGARQSIELSKELSQGLKALSRKEGVTLFMTLLAAFQTLLHRYSGQNDIVVGSPIANRSRTEIEGLIGFFVNTLVLRTNFNGDPTFKELLGRVREMALAAYAHQDLPFEKLVEELQPERSLSHPPLFQVMFALQNASVTDLRLSGLAVTPLQLEGVTAKFDLSLSMVEEADALRGSIEYNTDLFGEATIGQMMGHFQILLEEISKNADQRLSDLTLLTDKERRKILVEWNDTRKDYATDRCIHELFEEQVERTPESVAIRFGDQQLTYRVLNRRANQLARFLTKLGVGPETLVGVCVERSLELVVGLLGILKAGGAYVPLEPDFPQERLACMLHDTPVLLTQRKLLSQLPGAAIENPKSKIQNRSVVCLDTDWELVARESEDNLFGKAMAETLAYVIYTSGSTGRPKGVMITHQAIRNRLLWGQTVYPLSAADRVLQLASFSFDFSVWEVFAPLLAGARLVMTPPAQHLDSAKIVELMAAQGITTVHFVPSMLEVVLAEEGLSACDSLRRVFCGGEELPIKLQGRFFSQSDADLYNQYGPTEACIDATFWTCKPGSDTQVVPIGRPIANMQIYLLDSHLQPVPVGITGELYIGGVGLARGYLGRPDLTAEKFVPHVFSDESGARLYRTGDWARYRMDGNIEFLGRLDDQMKLRGFRIELGEIETVLSEHPAVLQAKVLVDNQPDRAPRLVAYVVPRHEDAPSIDALRGFLKAKLPSHMIPSKFVSLNALPVAANGKVDRRALSALDGSGWEAEQVFVAPRTPIEKNLARIWGEVLKLRRIGIHDDFFVLGGHSLLVARVISRVREIFQVEMPLRTLFEEPSLEDFARAIADSKNSRVQHPSLPSIAALPRRLQRLKVP
jgi:amino acid adenylation domain-containing protein